jgi:hypothetical protein
MQSSYPQSVSAVAIAIATVFLVAWSTARCSLVVCYCSFPCYYYSSLVTVIVTAVVVVVAVLVAIYFSHQQR